MGVKNVIKKIGDKAGNKVYGLSKLSSDQIAKVEQEREKYLKEKPNLNDSTAEEFTMKLMAANSVEIFNAYLSQLKELYLPIDSKEEYNSAFDPVYNIRYFNITKWVNNKKENNLEKLINVYAVLADEDCNIALVFNRTQLKTNVYLAVVNTGNVGNKTDVKNYKERLIEAIKGNFPGVEINNLGSDEGIGIIPCLDNNKNYSVATTSNIPNEKSEKFISQTIEKLLDGIVPDNSKEEYTIVLLATPIKDIEERKLKLAEFYSGLLPYSSWQTSFQYSENQSLGSSATVGVNVGASVGSQKGTNDTISENQSDTDNSSRTDTDTTSEGTSHTDSLSTSVSATAGPKFASVTAGVTGEKSDSTSKTVGQSVANTLGKAVTKGTSIAKGVTNSTNLGANFGANFARSSTVTAMIGKNEGITQSFENYNIKHALKLLDNQMKRLDQSSALGMWDFAAYVLSEDSNIANNVAHSYLALTQGEESYNSSSAINLWKGNVPEEENIAEEIVKYIKELRHPLFGLNIKKLEEDLAYNVYPSIVTATTSLSGKELAYSLNFPQKSISGLPVLECAEFGRNVITYDDINRESNKIRLGKIYHMNHVEKNDVNLLEKSLTSHVFITGSTGSGKSNTVYKMLNEITKNGKKYLVIEPAKGEYKKVFGNNEDVSVYGTNPDLTKLLKINPFSFPKDIHILEHMDRLVEIFNVCWPMYAGMPAVLKDAVQASYVECGWDLVTSKNKYGEDLYPTFDDVTRNIKTIIDKSDFDDENKGAYKGSLLIRLKSLTNGIYGLIFTNDELPNEKLFDENVIIDLSRVGSTETKSLIMGLLVLKLQEYRMTSNEMNSELKHVTILEEAHNILKRTSTEQSSESSNLLGKSVELLANAIAEMRTYGESFIIADQAPGLLDMSVIRNTNTKIIMRLPDQSDRELVGRAANLNEEQITELAKLPCGVAAIYQNEWVQPVLCKIDKYDSKDEEFIETEDVSEIVKENMKITSSLLDSLMNKSLFNINNKVGLAEIRYQIVKAKIDSKVKIDLIEYLESGSDESFDKLRTLLYDLLSAEKAISLSENKGDIRDWATNVVEKLNPSVGEYTEHQINLVLSLILYEQVTRDSRYNELLTKFTDVYQTEGCVYKWVR